MSISPTHLRTDPQKKEYLKELIEKKFGIYEELAKEVNIDISAISRFVTGNGKHFPFETYNKICKALGLDWREICLTQEKSIPPHNLLPNPVKVIGREIKLDAIHSFFAPKHPSEQPKIIVLHGLPGGGRTALVCHYADQYRESYPGGICHIRDPQEQCCEGFVRFFSAFFPNNLIPEDLDIIGQTLYCHQHWPNPDRPALLIIDDVDDYSFVTPLLAGMPGTFRVLITAPKPFDNAQKHICIAAPSEESALKILKFWLQHTDAETSNHDDRDLRSICRQLGSWPLALKLISKALGYMPARDVLFELRQQPEDWVSPVLFALGVIWKALSPKAQRLSLLLGGFACASIPASMLNLAIRNTSKGSRAAVSELSDFNLIQTFGYGETVTFRCHQLVHADFWQRLQAAKDKEEIYHAICYAIVDACLSIPDNASIEQSLEIDRISPHSIKAIKEYPDCFPDEVSTDLAKVYKISGEALFSLDDFDMTERCYQRAIDIYLESFGTNSTQVADMHVLFATLYRFRAGYNQERLQEAETKAQEAVDIYENTDLSYEDSGYFEAALTLATIQVKLIPPPINLEIKLQELLGKSPTDGKKAEILNNIGVFYEKLCQWGKSIDSHLQAIEINRKILGEKHSNTASSYNNIAKAYVGDNRIQDAIKFYDKAILIFEELSEDVQAAICYKNKGKTILDNEKNNSVRDMSNILEAKRSCERALDYFESEEVSTDFPYFQECREVLKNIKTIINA